MIEPIDVLKTRLESLDKERAQLTQQINQHRQRLQQLEINLIGTEHSHQTLSALIADLEKGSDEKAPPT